MLHIRVLTAPLNGFYLDLWRYINVLLIIIVVTKCSGVEC